MTESGEPIDMTGMTQVGRGPEERPPARNLRCSRGRRAAREVVISARPSSTVYYRNFRAVRDINLPILKNEITALIGPSGCGKTTFLRCLNRMNDLIQGARIEGTFLYHGVDLYASASTPSRCGGASAWSSRSRTRSRSRSTRTSRRPDRRATRATWTSSSRRASAGGALGRGEGQAEEIGPCALGWPAAASVHRAGDRDQPDVILMDEPCSALDPIATAKIEDLMQELWRTTRS